MFEAKVSFNDWTSQKIHILLDQMMQRVAAFDLSCQRKNYMIQTCQLHQFHGLSASDYDKYRIFSRDNVSVVI